ncbi:MAG: DNA-J related domain-containing protein [Aestuariibacter sp.]
MPSEKHIDALLTALDVLLQSGDKFSEFELIQRLQNAPFELFNPTAFSDNLTLFKTHFLVYHCLYQLQARYLKEGAGYLTISALHIERQDASHLHPMNAEDTKLRDYYLDLQQLQSTSEQDVQALLDDFWRRMGRVQEVMPDADAIAQALAFFDVAHHDVEWSVIKQRYRKKMHAIHPDKGGVKNDAQSAQAHFEILRCAYEK